MQKVAPRTSCVLFYSGKEKRKERGKGRKDCKEERVPRIKGEVEKEAKGR